MQVIESHKNENCLNFPVYLVTLLISVIVRSDGDWQHWSIQMCVVVWNTYLSHLFKIVKTWFALKSNLNFTYIKFWSIQKLICLIIVNLAVQWFWRFLRKSKKLVTAIAWLLKDLRLCKYGCLWYQNTFRASCKLQISLRNVRWNAAGIWG